MQCSLRWHHSIQWTSDSSTLLYGIHHDKTAACSRIRLPALHVDLTIFRLASRTSDLQASGSLPTAQPRGKATRSSFCPPRTSSASHRPETIPIFPGRSLKPEHGAPPDVEPTTSQICAKSSPTSPRPPLAFGQVYPPGEAAPHIQSEADDNPLALFSVECFKKSIRKILTR